MPNHWEKEEGKYKNKTKYRELKTVQGGDVDKVVDYIGDYIVSWNNPGINTDLMLGEEAEPENTGGDEEAAAEEESSGEESGGDDEEEEEDE